MKLAALAAAVALALASPAACAPGPPTTPPPAPIAPADEIAFVVEVRGLSGRPYARKVSMTVTGIGHNGRIAKYQDPATGELRPGPMTIIVTTPWRHISTMVGIASISMAAVYLGARGEYLSCYVERDGALIPGSRQERQIPMTGGGGRGGVEVVCVY